MFRVNSAKAAISLSGLLPSAVSIEATWTKLMPSASLARVAQAVRIALRKLGVHCFDQPLVLVGTIGLYRVTNDDGCHRGLLAWDCAGWLDCEMVTWLLRMAHPLDVLGSPVRREILLTLRERPLAVGELATRFPVSRPAISRHLRVLEDAGLVEHHSGVGRGAYTVRLQGFASVRDFLDEFWDTALSRLQELARE